MNELSYEQARAELADLVGRLESGRVDLEESLALWERGEALAQHCQDWLDGAFRRLDAAKDGASARSDQAPVGSGEKAPQDQTTEGDGQGTRP